MRTVIEHGGNGTPTDQTFKIDRPSAASNVVRMYDQHIGTNCIFFRKKIIFPIYVFEEKYWVESFICLVILRL